LIVAGLAAGAANLVLGFAFAHIVGVEKIQSVLRAHDLRVIGQPSDALPHAIVRLLLGVGTTLLFWAVSPRFASPPVAAVTAGLFAWAFVYAYTAWGHHHIGLFPASLSWMLAGWGLVEMIATAFVGGWIATGSGFWRS
jgi:hypothetical protein